LLELDDRAAVLLLPKHTHKGLRGWVISGQLKALQTDLENAQNNISSLQRQLDDLMD